jgi:hypothetical protein
MSADRTGPCPKCGEEEFREYHDIDIRFEPETNLTKLIFSFEGVCRSCGWEYDLLDEVIDEDMIGEPKCSFGNPKFWHLEGRKVEEFCGCREFESKTDTP